MRHLSRVIPGAAPGCFQASSGNLASNLVRSLGKQSAARFETISCRSFWPFCSSTAAHLDNALFSSGVVLPVVRQRVEPWRTHTILSSTSCCKVVRSGSFMQDATCQCNWQPNIGLWGEQLRLACFRGCGHTCADAATQARCTTAVTTSKQTARGPACITAPDLCLLQSSTCIRSNMHLAALALCFGAHSKILRGCAGHLTCLSSCVSENRDCLWCRQRPPHCVENQPLRTDRRLNYNCGPHHNR